jgi:hypothetical protein
MTEQERFEEIYRQRQPVVVIHRPTPPPEPTQEHPPQPAQKAAPLPRSCHPLEQVIIADIRLSWNCVARLSLQFVLMSFLVASFIVGIVSLIGFVCMGIATSLQTMPPPPLR